SCKRNSDSLSEWVLIRPRKSRKFFVYDRHRLRRVGVALVEQSSADPRNTDRLEIIRSDGAPVHIAERLRNRYSAFEFHYADLGHACERQTVDHSCGLHARNCVYLLDKVLTKCSNLPVRGMLCPGDGQLHTQHAVRHKAWIHTRNLT